MGTPLIRFIFCLAACFSVPSFAQGSLGVVLMHGKQGGGPRDTSLDALHKKLLDAGVLVVKPEMPWSHSRYIEGHWDQAMAEIRTQVQELRKKGASKVALIGHSLGSPAALSFAARHPGEVQALGLLAPGHIPHYYSLCIPYSPVRMCAVKDGVERARKEVEAGKGADKQGLPDINQGRRGIVWMTPQDYLSYFDPASDAEMAVTAPRIAPEVPVLWLIGDGDYLIREGRAYVFDKLPKNSRSLYLEISGNHMTAPAVGADQILRWLQSALAH